MTPTDTIHQGQNIRRFREMLGLKQEGLAHELGGDWSQKKVSLLEAKEVIDADILEQVAKALKVPADAIKNFTDEIGVNIINNTFNDSSILNGINYNPTFNSVDKWAALVDENNKLYAALLKEKEERIVLMQQLLDAKK